MHTQQLLEWRRTVRAPPDWDHPSPSIITLPPVRISLNMYVPPEAPTGKHQTERWHVSAHPSLRCYSRFWSIWNYFKGTGEKYLCFWFNDNKKNPCNVLCNLEGLTAIADSHPLMCNESGCHVGALLHYAIKVRNESQSSRYPWPQVCWWTTWRHLLQRQYRRGERQEDTDLTNVELAANPEGTAELEVNSHGINIFWKSQHGSFKSGERSWLDTFFPVQ